MDSPALLELTALAVAEDLQKRGYPQEAANLLFSTVIERSNAISVKSVLALARITYEARNWTETANLCRAILQAEPHHVETLLKFSHCLIEMGDRHGAAETLKRLQIAAGKSEGPLHCDELLQIVYENVCLHLRENDLLRASELINLSGLPGSYVSLVTEPPTATSPAKMDDRELLKRFEVAADDWERSGGHVPYSARLDGLKRHQKAASLANRKVLLVMRKYFLGTPDSREHELAVFFRESAKAAGLQVIFFPAEPFLNTNTVTPGQQYAELDRLLRTIICERPDLVVFDDLAMVNGGDTYISPEVYKAAFSRLKAICNFKLVGFYGDSWTDASVATIRFVKTFADAVWHQNWESADHPSDGLAGQDFLAPTPYFENLFDRESSRKDIGAAFIGGVFQYNFPRGIWLTLLQARKSRCEIFLSNHSKTGSPAGSSTEEYARFLSRVKVTINFASRSTQKKILTGRAWEAVVSGSLLLEEDNHVITNYFVPFVHYVPYRTIFELERYLDFFANNESERQRIADRAYAWYRKLFSKERVWSDLLTLIGLQS